MVRWVRGRRSCEGVVAATGTQPSILPPPSILWHLERKLSVPGLSAECSVLRSDAVSQSFPPAPRLARGSRVYTGERTALPTCFSAVSLEERS